MRLIDADALRKRFDDEVPIRPISLTYNKEDVIRAVLDAPTIGGWISVKDRLPEAIPGTTSSAFVLVCYKTKCEITGDTFSVVTMSSFNTRCKEWHIRDPRSPHEIVKVTHWMPKPEPPEEVTGND